MATQARQGQVLTSTATETEFTLEGMPPLGAEVYLYVVTGTFQYATGPIGSAARIADSGYESVTTAGTTRKVTVLNGSSLRLKGAATVGITW